MTTNQPSSLVDAIHGHPEAKLVFHDDAVEDVSVDQLLSGAEARAAALVASGVRRGDRVGLVGPNRPEWAKWAFAIWRAGGTLVPLSFPLRIRDRDAHRERLGAILSGGGCRLVMADPSLLPIVPDGLGRSWDDVPKAQPQEPVRIGPDDPAVLQFTSGSTAFPKGAEITHGAVLAAVAARAEVLALEPGRSAVAGWVPLFHDLGLIFHLVLPTVAGVDSHFLPTRRFARDPAEWFRMLTTTHATITSGSTSGWAAALRAALGRPDGIDLRELDFGTIAAEMIDPSILDRLRDDGPRLGLRPDAICGGYGLAEFTLTATANPPGAGTPIDTVDPTALTEGRAVPTGDDPTKRIASCGPPLPGVDVRIDVDGSPAPDRRVGEILLKGPSMMSGYVGSEESPIVDGWLHTGDLGYLADGELYVTGRIKDMVIVMGQNHHPEDFEWAAERVDGVRKGRSVAFGHPEREDAVVLLVEPSSGADPDALPNLVRRRVRDAVAGVPLTVVVVERGRVEKTTSGKLRRRAMRDAFARGDLEPLASTSPAPGP